VAVLTTDAKHVGTIIRDARERLGLTQEFCAQKCGLSVAWYVDVETSDDEFFDNISLGTARRLCLLLGLDLLDLAAEYLKVPIGDRSPMDDTRFWSRHDLVTRTLLAKAMTDADLADAIGFGTITVQELQWSPDHIESLTIRVVAHVATTLDIDPGCLLGNRGEKPKPNVVR
jgi:DNA-binding XRE family transcriptional regulator